MAVFTSVTPEEVDGWLQGFQIGRLRKLEGIASGIENTNYFVSTDGAEYGGEFVLTIFEKLTREQLPFYLEFMLALANHAVEVPRPIADTTGAILHTLKGKPCALATRLPGGFELDPTPEHCRQVGAALAQLHLAGDDYRRARPELMHDNPRGLAWWIETVDIVAPHLPPALQLLLREEVRAQAQFAATPAYAKLKRGPVHADLFRNNVLFAGTRQAPRLGGFIDFYFAGVDSWLFDLAVTVNDWCIDLATGALDAVRTDALLQAYAAQRPYTGAERDAWDMMLRAAALRFWMSRLYDYYMPREAETLTPHDPSHFERVLRLRRLRHATLPA